MTCNTVQNNKNTKITWRTGRMCTSWKNKKERDEEETNVNISPKTHLSTQMSWNRRSLSPIRFSEQNREKYRR